jgi:hypothetical protein
MRTVQNLIDELRKFPLDAMCSAYEGIGGADDIVGIVISKPGNIGGPGVIHCGPTRTERATILIDGSTST